MVYWVQCCGYATPINARYHRLGFDYEILLIVNCKFFRNSQSKESQ